jgi:alkylation response protein AidB-like acyl-CoA dehydrogenase
LYPLLTNDPERAEWCATAVDSLERLAEKHGPTLAACTRDSVFPREAYQDLGAAGLLGVFAPTEYGGSGLGIAEYCVVGEEAARTGMISGQVAAQGIRWFVDWASPEQKERWLGGLIDGTVIFSESISEQNAGSSFRRMEGVAVRDGDDWLITAHKIHVNLGADCDVTLVYVMTEDGLTSFLVDMSLPGVRTVRTDPIGLRLIPTADVIFESVRVPNSALLGQSGQGMETFLATFNVSRLGNASELIGLGRRALALGLEYAETRSVGKNVVTEFQGQQWQFAEAWVSLYAASLSRDEAVLAHEAGRDISFATSATKLLAAEAAEKAASSAFALVGGPALYYDVAYSEILNDIKVLRVAGGSVEVLRNYVASRILRDPSYRGLR